MPNPFGAPEISVQEVEAKRKAGEQFIWLDVREPQEYTQVHIDDERVLNVPLSELAARQLTALPAPAQDKDAPIVAFCHHGGRSAQVTAWLRQQGWTNVVNMTGGIHAWAQSIDPAVGTY